MGYMGLKSWADSDTAADVIYKIVTGLGKTLTTAVRERGNAYNTDGATNVGFIFDSLITPNAKRWAETDVDGDLAKVATQAIEGLGKLIAGAEDSKGWDDEDNRRNHLSAYKRLKRRLEVYIEVQEEFWAKINNPAVK
jgi:hypothetical protein